MKKFMSLLLLASIILGGCSNTEDTKKDAKALELSVAINSWAGFAPVKIAEELGYYQDLGLDLEILEIEDISAVKTAIQADQIDLTWGTGDVLLTFADAGIDVQAFYAIDWSNGGDGVVVTEEIQSWKDFEGKSFVGQEGLPPVNLFLYALEDNGVDINSVEFIEMETAAAALAFKAEQVDIAAVYQPYLSEAAERENAEIFVSSADYPYVITDFISAKETTLNEKSEAVKAFIQATDRAIQFIENSPEEAISITAKHFNLSTEDVAGIFLDIEFPSLEENKKLFNSEEIITSFNTFQTVMIKAGILEDSVNIDEMINGEFVQ